MGGKIGAAKYGRQNMGGKNKKNRAGARFLWGFQFKSLILLLYLT